MLHRYPLIYNNKEQISILTNYLALTGTEQDSYVAKYGLTDEDECEALIQSYILQHSKSYPMQIGDEMDTITKNKLALYLARKYLKDYKSSHCTPLPVEFLQQIWDTPSLSSSSFNSSLS